MTTHDFILRKCQNSQTSKPDSLSVSASCFIRIPERYEPAQKHNTRRLLDGLLFSAAQHTGNV